MLNQTDELEELISGCAQNDRGAQEKLYRHFYSTMMGTIRRYFPDEDTATEILNIGFTKVFLNIKSFKFKGSFEGWMRRIMFHEVSNYANKHVKYKNKIVLMEKDAFVHKDHANNLYYNDLLKLLNELPEATRVVFNMFAIDGLPHKEIAKSLNISEGTSKWHVSSARKILKEKIEKLHLHE